MERSRYQQIEDARLAMIAAILRKDPEEIACTKAILARLERFCA